MELEGRTRARSALLLIFSIAAFLVYDCRASFCRDDDAGEITSRRQLAEYLAQVPKTIVELQPFRQTTSIKTKDSRGEEGLATLINLNPNINMSYLLRLNWRNTSEVYHLENADPQMRKLLLEDGHPHGLVIAEGEKSLRCDLWGKDSVSGLTEAKKSGTYAPLCGGKLYLRNPTKGHRTRIEKVTDFLREKVPGGEKIVVFVRDSFFKYLYQQKAGERAESKPIQKMPEGTDNTPAPARLDPRQPNRMVKPIDLGIEIQGSIPDGLVLGAWYHVKDNPGIYVSLLMPGGIMSEILQRKDGVSPLDKIEAGALVYLVGFDLDRFDLKYAIGTDHPKVVWSDRTLDQMRDKSLPGPDGLGTIGPFVPTGLISPVDVSGTAATFTGGFKRTHGSFKYGDLARKSHGSHYGFIENGVIFSKLQPGLATIYVLNDRRADMKTWIDKDQDLLPRIQYARQNGVPIIIEFDQGAQMSVAGPLVSRWGEGNWSGSANKNLRTMRSGAALQEFGGKRFLIYAFFWSATPSAMARVFQSYQCRYAMLLDMNALEHTYLAVYKRLGPNFYVQHLIQGMSEVDRSVKGQYVPRFLGYSDNRDFFYLTRKASYKEKDRMSDNDD